MDDAIDAFAAACGALVFGDILRAGPSKLVGYQKSRNFYWMVTLFIPSL